MTLIPKKLTDQVYILGNAYFQSYLVAGSILIEGGVTSSAGQVIEQLTELGIGHGELRYLVIPHAHFDHVCGIPLLKQAFPKLQVIASPIAAKVLAKEKVVRGFFAEDRVLARNLGFDDYAGSSAAHAAIAVDWQAADGEELDLGQGRKLQFRMMPGHSPCSMAAYLTQEKVLFSSDCAGYPITSDGIFPMYFSGLRDYVGTLERLMETDIAVLAAAHELVLETKKEIGEFLRRSLDQTLKLHHMILRETGLGKEPGEISSVLFDRFYRGGISNYSRENLRICTDLLVRRSLEASTLHT